jgi:16S rRNA (guanine527-N7)-methyltransferase
MADHALNSEQQRSLSIVLHALATDEHAPTSVREPAQAQRVHVADSLAALDLEEVRGAGRLVDIGSGAGFPGLPLAVALPAAEIALVESQARKCAFLERVSAEAGIENARVVCARAEEWEAGFERCDVVVARAVASQPVVLEYAAPLLRIGGLLVDWRGRRAGEEEEQADRASAILGLRREQVLRADPIEGATDHHLHTFRKLSATPPRFPRRTGMARKRPLG